MCRFDEMYALLESNLSFANDEKFMSELRAAVETPKQWAQLVQLYCDVTQQMMSFVVNLPVPM